jgi:sulfite reductase (NADPH) flavoprotein alpha-component
MSVRETFPEGALSIEQWQHVQELSRTLSPAQARWISGYFAGLDAGMSRSGAEPAAAVAPDARSLTILYGTETGNSRALATGLAEAAAVRGRAATVADMADYNPRRLKEEQDLLIVVSTYGEGDPPQPAVGFFEFIEGRRAPRLEGARFSVLALGDSTYEKYCEAGKRLDLRLAELGATRLHDRVDCDVDYDDPAAVWSTAVLDLVAAQESAAFAALPGTAGATLLSSASLHDKRNPFPAPILENMIVVGRGSTKETRHIELDLAGSGLDYQPGDAIGIVPRNDPATVAALIEAAGLDADASVEVKGGQRSLADALESHFEITLSTPRFLAHWGKLAGAGELERLGEEGRESERTAYLRAHHVVDIVRKFPLGGLAAQEFVAGLRPLQPRLYSIASSLAFAPDEAHITLAPVRYELHGERRCGVASAHLADRAEAGASLPVYIQPNPHFRLPADDVPIIMIGAGTGVAPYRAFMQEREARGARGRSWLFFGERNFRSDFLYQAEWQEHLKNGILGRMDVAFSRDAGEKVYVQHRMLAQAKDLYAWLEEGAHFYVCGDEKQMARDVHETLIRIVAEQGRAERETAEAYVRKLAADHRYQRDVY